MARGPVAPPRTQAVTWAWAGKLPAHLGLKEPNAVLVDLGRPSQSDGYEQILGGIKSSGSRHPNPNFISLLPLSLSTQQRRCSWRRRRPGSRAPLLSLSLPCCASGPRPENGWRCGHEASRWCACSPPAEHATVERPWGRALSPSQSVDGGSE